jgi:hypothetical protein
MFDSQAHLHPCVLKGIDKPRNGHGDRELRFRMLPEQPAKPLPCYQPDRGQSVPDSRLAMCSLASSSLGRGPCHHRLFEGALPK